MNTQAPEAPATAANQAVVATYTRHSDAEAAVRTLVAAGIPIKTISIIGRNFETHEDVQGFYRPADAAKVGAAEGAWFGGIFGLMLGAFGMFVFPVLGALFVIGPLSGMVAGAIGGAGIGALVSALVAAGVPGEQALKYQERLQAGDFLLVVHADPEQVERASEALQNTAQTTLQTHRGGR
jgi:hypothetical protein